MAHETWPLAQGGRLPLEPYGLLIDEWLFDDEVAGGGTSGASAHTIAVPSQSASGWVGILASSSRTLTISGSAAGAPRVTAQSLSTIVVPTHVMAATLHITGASVHTIVLTGYGGGGTSSSDGYDWTPRIRRARPRRRARQ